MKAVVPVGITVSSSAPKKYVIQLFHQPLIFHSQSVSNAIDNAAKTLLVSILFKLNRRVYYSHNDPRHLFHLHTFCKHSSSFPVYSHSQQSRVMVLSSFSPKLKTRIFLWSLTCRNLTSTYSPLWQLLISRPSTHFRGGYC